VQSPSGSSLTYFCFSFVNLSSLQCMRCIICPAFDWLEPTFEISSVRKLTSRFFLLFKIQLRFHSLSDKLLRHSTWESSVREGTMVEPQDEIDESLSTPRCSTFCASTQTSTSFKTSKSMFMRPNFVSNHSLTPPGSSVSSYSPQYSEGSEGTASSSIITLSSYPFSPVRAYSVSSAPPHSPSLYSNRESICCTIGDVDKATEEESPFSKAFNFDLAHRTRASSSIATEPAIIRYEGQLDRMTIGGSLKIRQYNFIRFQP
jgi:hypothetical protein